tara:strand:- start:817 stop:963 length:147 start_codon:yes stop_codon:yes gene_type:complete
MDFKLMTKAIQNKTFILVDRFTKQDDLTVGDWATMTEEQKQKYQKNEK